MEKAYRRIIEAAALLLISAAFLITVGCPFPMSEKGETAALTIGVGAPFAEKTVFPDFSAALALIDHYEVSGTGPDSSTFGPITLADSSSSTTVDDLVIGEWTITMTGVDGGGNTIVEGNTIVSLNSLGATVTVDVTFQSGQGDVSVTLEWPASAGIDQVLAKLESGVETDIYDGDTNALFSATNVSTGSQLLSFKLYAGGLLAATVLESVHIYHNLTTSTTLTLTESQISSAPSAPADFSADTVTSDQVDFSWTATDVITETGFEIERDTIATFDSINLTTFTPSANATTYNDTTVSANSTYYYRIRSVNSFGNSSWVDLSNPGPSVTTPEESITFADSDVEAEVRSEIAKPTGPIYASDLVGLTYLNMGWSVTVTDLAGLEHCVDLAQFYSYDAQVSDITPMTGLTNLTTLVLQGTDLTSLPDLSATSLYWVDFAGSTSLSDVSELSDLSATLQRAILADSQLSSLAMFEGFTSLIYLDLSDTPITSIAAYTTPLTSLERLYLEQITYESTSSSYSPLNYRYNMSGQSPGDLSGQLNGTTIDDASFANLVVNFPNLTDLMVSGNTGINDFSPIEEFYNYDTDPNLDEFYCDWCEIDATKIGTMTSGANAEYVLERVGYVYLDGSDLSGLSDGSDISMLAGHGNTVALSLRVCTFGTSTQLDYVLGSIGVIDLYLDEIDGTLFDTFNKSNWSSAFRGGVCSLSLGSATVDNLLFLADWFGTYWNPSLSMQSGSVVDVSGTWIDLYDGYPDDNSDGNDDDQEIVDMYYNDYGIDIYSDSW